MKEYEDERFCEHCQRDTPHECRDSGHERDGSHDRQECKVCHWYSTGMRSGYYPPSEPISDVSE